MENRQELPPQEEETKPFEAPPSNGNDSFSVIFVIIFWLAVIVAIAAVNPWLAFFPLLLLFKYMD